jgi:hypothetical protein
MKTNSFDSFALAVAAFLAIAGVVGLQYATNGSIMQNAAAACQPGDPDGMKQITSGGCWRRSTR